MPGIVDRGAAAKGTAVVGNNPPILTDDDTIGIGWTSTGRPIALALTEYLLLSKRTRQVSETEACTSWKPSKRPAYGTSFCRSSSKTSQIVLSPISGWQWAFA